MQYTEMKEKIYSLLKLDKSKKRRIAKGSLKGMFFYGEFKDKSYFNGSHERLIVEAIKNIMDNDKKIVFDIGAHYGFYTMIFCRLLGDKGKVYSFEPNPYCFEKLKRTVALNNFSEKVHLFSFGVGDKNEYVTMMVLPDNLARSTCEDSIKEHYKNRYESREIKIETKSLDTLKLQKPDLVKIDVEGFEAKVIKGMYGIIKRSLPDLIIELHGVGKEGKEKNFMEVYHLLSKLGYHCINIENNLLINGLGKDLPLEGHILASLDKSEILKIIKP